MNADEIGKHFRNATWFPKPHGRVFDMPTLVKFVKKMKKTLKGSLITKHTPIKDFKELMIEYELVIVTRVTTLMRNDKHVTVTLFSITKEDKCGNTAHSFFIKDPYVRDESMDQARDSLRTADPCTTYDSLTFMTNLTEELTIYFCDMIFGREIVQQIMRDLRVNRDDIQQSPGGMRRSGAEEQAPLLEHYCWDDIWKMVKRQLSNDMPRRLLESYFVLIRPDGMGVARWCIFSTQTYDLVVSEAFTTVGLLIRWNLFDGQVTTD